jgi:sterol desaturase/sphingolipid hydroxylase (fatty acid hydroxylase superfamily)
VVVRARMLRAPNLILTLVVRFLSLSFSLPSSCYSLAGFYFAHRLLHETRLYYWHKRHHEYRDSTVYATFYVGLLDSVITDFIPAGFGIVYFEMHQVSTSHTHHIECSWVASHDATVVFATTWELICRYCVYPFNHIVQWTVWMFTLPLIANALRVHCGYDNSKLLSALGFNPALTLPMCTDAERTHDMHHRYNTCNYGGAYFFWDRICGTWMDPDQEVADKKAGKPIVTRFAQPYDEAAAKVAAATEGEEAVPMKKSVKGKKGE